MLLLLDLSLRLRSGNDVFRDAKRDHGRVLMEWPFSFALSKIAQMGDGSAAEIADNLRVTQLEIQV